MKPNEVGNDAGALLRPVAWLNQTKGLELLAKKQNTVAKADVETLVAKQKAAGGAFNFGQDVTEDKIVYDLFTNRPKGARLKNSDLPPNTLLTTLDNFEKVVGPVFASTKILFEKDK